MSDVPPSILRPPPPPRHHGSDGSLMVVDSLPDELLFEILVRLPAQDIYETARVVCRRWYRIIHTRDFVYAHLQHATCGLIIQLYDRCQHPIVVALRHGRIEISNFSYNFRDEVLAGCNDLILEHGFKNWDDLYIANPATKQYLVLPPFPEPICYPSPGIAYAAASTKYKVAALYVPSALAVPQLAILTVGVDNFWRHVQTQHLSRININRDQLWEGKPLITEGFMHWIIQDTRVLTFDVETEIITETTFPQGYRNTGWYYLSTGKYLSLLIGLNGYSWEVWEMKPETREWTKLPNINLEPQKCKFEVYRHGPHHTLVPIGWLKHQEVLVFGIYGPSRAYFAYVVHTQEIHLFELDCGAKRCESVHHRNSLLWL